MRNNRYSVAVLAVFAIAFAAAAAGGPVGNCGKQCRDRIACGYCEVTYCVGGHATDGCERDGTVPCACYGTPVWIPVCVGFGCVPSCPRPPCPFLTEEEDGSASAGSESPAGGVDESCAGDLPGAP